MEIKKLYHQLYHVDDCLRSTLAFVIKKGEKSSTVLDEHLGLFKRREMPKRDLAFIKINFKPDFLKMMCQLP